MANGTLKVSNIETSSGSGTITLGQSGETLSVPSGATFSATAGTMTGQNYPAFHARLNSNQDISNAATTKVQCGTEELDTNNMYDNTTNYRFTPTVAGNYYVYAQANLSSNANTQFVHGNIDIQKNGSSIVIYDHNLQSNPGNGLSVQGNRIIEMNGSSDYLELFVLMNTNNSTQRIFGGSTGTTFFGAYRIGA